MYPNLYKFIWIMSVQFLPSFIVNYICKLYFAYFKIKTAKSNFGTSNKQLATAL